MFYALLILLLSLYLFIHQPSFGKIAKGERLARIRRSPNYRDGSFQNLHDTPMLTGGKNYFQVFAEFMFKKSKGSVPEKPLPSQKTDLHSLAPDENVLVWFGHSSYFIQADGKTFLADPVFSGNASPVSFTTKSFPGTDVYAAEDMPGIDYLFISHDHWDHLDYTTLRALRPKVKKIITSLGTAAHLEYWGYDTAIIFEKDWNETLELEPGFKMHTFPARHFSGRGLKRNQGLWMSVALTTPRLQLYLGGDSGYDMHFAEIGNRMGYFDLAILECGRQYNENWKYIHMMPEETVQAAIDLRAGKLLPVHWGKFSLSLHAWDEPIQRAVAEAERKQLPVIHPMIGEKVELLRQEQPFRKWWQTV